MGVPRQARPCHLLTQECRGGRSGTQEDAVSHGRLLWEPVGGSPTGLGLGMTMMWDRAAAGQGAERKDLTCSAESPRPGPCCKCGLAGRADVTSLMRTVFSSHNSVSPSISFSERCMAHFSVQTAAPHGNNFSAPLCKISALSSRDLLPSPGPALALQARDVRGARQVCGSHVGCTWGLGSRAASGWLPQPQEGSTSGTQQETDGGEGGACSLAFSAGSSWAGWVPGPGADRWLSGVCDLWAALALSALEMVPVHLLLSPVLALHHPSGPPTIRRFLESSPISPLESAMCFLLEPELMAKKWHKGPAGWVGEEREEGGEKRMEKGNWGRRGRERVIFKQGR